MCVLLNPVIDLLVPIEPGEEFYRIVTVDPVCRSEGFLHGTSKSGILPKILKGVSRKSFRGPSHTSGSWAWVCKLRSALPKHKKPSWLQANEQGLLHAVWRSSSRSCQLIFQLSKGPRARRFQGATDSCGVERSAKGFPPKKWSQKIR